MSSETSDKLGFPKLGENNYSSWSVDMQAKLMDKRYWRGHIETEKRPSDPLELEDWQLTHDAASGLIYSALEQQMKELVRGFLGEPKKMWDTLEAHCNQKKPTTRFIAMENLLGIQKREDESLPALCMRISSAQRAMKDTRPLKFDLDALDNDLACMALIRALPPSEYGSFRSLLLLQKEVTLVSLMDSCRLEETNRSTTSSSSSAAFATSSPNNPNSTCNFCGRTGHWENGCHTKETASKAAKSQAQSGRKKKKGNKPGTGKANEAQENTSNGASSSSSASSQAANIAEFAGKASASSHSSSRTAGSDWNADTGATSHMSPHRHWFYDYTPYRTPIRLANDSIIYSAGVGSVRFQPVVKGRPGRLLEFTRVLHVPDLCSNLLSVLYLTRNKEYDVRIHRSTLYFFLHRSLLFTATVNDNNAAYLDGKVVPAIEFEMAGAVSTLPVDSTLWHRRFGHLNHGDLKEMIRHGLAHGIAIQSDALSDPICEPCLAGKLHRAPIPKSATHRASKPLELVHSDLHGPISVQTPQGWRYWITFIDDYSRYWVVTPLRKKSDAFEALKRFIAFAENQLDSKLKCLRDDKGGEYISKEMDSFLKAAGVQRQHTTRNEPHQNGVAERANRTLGEAITAVMTEAKLPPSFWAYGLAAVVHQHNRFPTSALVKSTPYEKWFGSKPDVSHLRIFGCLAYVHVQKDQRTSLQPHYRKCIFMGYPTEFKGWVFWDPVARKEIVSNNAVFDERYFPGTSRDPLPDLTGPFEPDAQGQSTPDTPRTSGSAEQDESDDQVGVKRKPNAPLPPPAQNAPESRPATPPAPPPGDDAVPPSPPPRQESPPPTPPRSPALGARRFPLRDNNFAEPAYPHPFRHAQPRRRQQPPAEPVRRSTRETRPPGRWWEIVRPPPHPEPGPAPQPVPEDEPAAADDNNSDVSDDDELNLLTEELDDGHEDMHEFALLSALAEGAAYMDSHWEEMDVSQVLNLVHSDFAMKASASSDAPKTFGDAVSRSDGQEYLQAAIDEVKALIDNGTFIVRERRPEDRPIGSRWVFLVKRKADGSIDRYKGRVVAQGFSQRPGFDFTETWAPTAKMAAIRAILATAAFEDWEIEQVDISSAFLNGELDEDISMKVFDGLRQIRPDLFKGGSPNDQDWVLALKKALYGLKQSPRQWHKELCRVMSELGFKKIESVLAQK